MNETKYDLIVTVVERGFADEVMRSSRKAGASGGTILNARGTGMHVQKKLFGSVIEPEKEVVLIISEREKRAALMEQITRDVGLNTDGLGLCFSLPLDAVKGMTALEEKQKTPPEGGEEE